MKTFIFNVALLSLSVAAFLGVVYWIVKDFKKGGRRF